MELSFFDARHGADGAMRKLDLRNEDDRAHLRDMIKAEYDVRKEGYAPDTGGKFKESTDRLEQETNRFFSSLKERADGAGAPITRREIELLKFCEESVISARHGPDSKVGGNRLETNKLGRHFSASGPSLVGQVIRAADRNEQIAPDAKDRFQIISKFVPGGAGLQ